MPCDIAVKDLADKFSIATLHSKQTAGKVSFKELKAGETLPGNSIALIRAKQEGEQTMLFPATTIRASENVEKTLGDYVFRGTLQTTMGADHATGWLLDAGKMRPIDADEQINNFRWYVEGKDAAPLQNVELVVADENETTAIGRLNAEGKVEIYDLAGRRLDAKTARGTVRIVNGQKTF